MPGPEIKALVDMLRANPPLQGDDIQAMRSGMAAATGTMPLPDDVSFEPVDAGGVPAEWTQADGASEDRVVLYLHGGGYTMGGVATHRALAGGVSRAASCRVLSVDYRLGPEHPYPAAVEDATSAYGYLLSQGVLARDISIAGDSAGGGLAMACLIALRDADTALPASAVCISPWVDLTQSGASMETKADEDPMVSRDTLQTMADAYLAGTDPKAPTASPLFADLSGLPPLLIQVGSAETLLDDATRLAKRANAQGTEATLEVWDGMIHVWHAFAALVPEGQQAIDRIGEFLSSHP